MNRIANSADATISHYIKSASEDRALRKCPVDIFSKVPGSVAGRVAMGIYKEHRGTDDTLQLVEHAIYGSSRLGLNTTIVDLSDGAEDNDPVVALDYGTRQYELSDHLGNVSVVLSGTRLPNTGNTNFTADVLSANEYYPFGMVLPNKSFSSESYRYGFNGMEKDDEMKGAGNHYTSHFRQYDPRTGRWFSLDDLKEKYPYSSPYVAFMDNPIFFIDSNGDRVYHFSKTTNSNKVAVIHVTKSDINEKGLVDKWDGKALEDMGWDYIFVDDLTDAETFIKENYKEGQIDHLAIRTHGSGQIQTTCEDGECKSVDHGVLFLMNEGGTAMKTSAEEIEGKEGSIEGESEQISALEGVLKYASDNVTIAFAACQCAENNVTSWIEGDESGASVALDDYTNFPLGFALLHLADKPNATVYISTNTSTMFSALNNGDGRNVTTTKNFINPFGWVKFDNSGMEETGKNLAIKPSGIEETNAPSNIENNANQSNKKSSKHVKK